MIRGTFWIFRAPLASLFGRPALWRRLQRPKSGAILVLLALFIPIILGGIKYSDKLFQYRNHAITKSDDGKFLKVCAREVALTVAQNWNPGLTLAEQQDAVYKIADAIYNSSPLFYNSVVGRAVPGLIVYDDNGNLISPHPSSRQVVYNSKTKHMRTYQSAKRTPSKWNAAYAMWLGVDKATAPSQRITLFDVVQQDNSAFSLIHQDIFTEPHLLVNGASGSTEAVVYCTPTSDDSGVGNYFFDDLLISNYYTASINDKHAASATSSGMSDGTYSVRVPPSNKEIIVKVEVDNDRIKATTDSDVAYAVPAQCDVDIVLAVPTNAAACNVNNRDMASDTPENCFDSANGDSPTATPLYQMGQALKNFVKTHFYHVRGVNMALIPYSAKVSLSPDRAVAWTVAFPPFVDTSINTQLISGACLYSTSGVKDAPLRQSAKTTSRMSGDTPLVTDTPYFWGDVISACPIMFRAGNQQTEAKYGGNSYFGGFLLSSTNPSSGDSYKYLRMNLNPCYVGYANLYAMRCTKDCETFLPNPYYIIEPTADLVKIYEMCNALYPIYDTCNVSNFLFVPLEWADNLLQNWAADPSVSAKDGQGAGSGTSGSGTDDGATLSRPSKTASGRKKAVILLVNKPDWFEPGEMTYLGFNNDKSELSTVISDKIDFSINYSDTSYRFLDGSYNTGRIVAGPYKFLRYSLRSGSVARNSSYGNYYSSTGTSKIRLTFPRKGLFQIKVAPIGSIQFFNNNGVEDNIGTYPVDGSRSFSFAGGTPAAGAYSSGGKNFAHNLSVYKVRYSTTNAFISDATLTNQVVRDYTGCYGYGKSAYKALILNTGAAATRSSSNCYPVSSTYGYAGFHNVGDANFNTVVSYLARFRDPCVHVYNGAHIQNGDSGTYYSDNTYPVNDQHYYFGGLTGTFTMMINGSGTTKCDGTARSNNTNFTMTDNSPFAYHRISATNWLCDVYVTNPMTKRLASSDIADYTRIIEDNGAIYLMNLSSNLSDKIVAGNYVCFNGDGALSVTANAKGTLKFAAGAKGDTAVHTVTDEMIYTIEPDNLNATTGGEYYVDVELTGVKLISAEISNRPYSTAQIAKPTSFTYNDVEFIASHQSGPTLSFGSRQTSTSGTKSWEVGGTDTITNCDSIQTGTSKTEGKLTYKESSRGGSSTMPSEAWWQSVCYENGKFVIVAFDSNKAAYSTDGINWTAATLPSSALWFSVCYGNGKFVAVANNSNKAAYSTDGINWTAATLPSSSTRYSVCYGNGKFVTVAFDSNEAAYSTDGINWTAATLPSEAGWTSVCYGNGKFVAVATGSTKAAYSTTGTGTWTAATLPGNVEWRSVCYGNGKFVAVANGSTKAAYSTDGINWSDATLPSSVGWFSVCYGNGKFVAVSNGPSNFAGPSNKAAYSTDGINWTAATLPFEVKWKSVCYGGGKFVAVAGGYSSKAAAYSTDGINWSGSECQLSFSQKGKISITTSGSGKITFKSGVSGTTSYDVSGTQTIDIEENRLTGSSLTYFLTEGVLTKTVSLDTLVSKTVNVTNVADKLCLRSLTKAAATLATTNGVSNVTPSASDNGRYYYDITGTPRYAKRDRSVTEELYDIIDFSSKTSSNILSTEGLNGSKANGLYTVASTNNAKIKSNKLGMIKLTVAPAMNAANGTINILGSNKTITEKTTITIDASSLKKSGDTYYIDFKATNLVLIHAKFMRWQPIFTKPATPSWDQQPINAALYNYEYGTTVANLDDYVDQEVDFNRATLKKLTTAACAKLKDDFGSDVRIYGIKYRKQNKYASTTGNGAANHSYSEVDVCANSTGGTAYDIGTEEELKTTLDDIAEKIKIWSGGTEAKNVQR